MIKNERQYRITKAHAEKFARALEELNKSSTKRADVHPLLLKAEEDALRSQLADLEGQLQEYEALRSGEVPLPDLDSFVEMPAALIKTRIARGLSQKELAEKMAMKEQQIQRYEATEYATASLGRIKQVIQALNVKAKGNRFRNAEKHTKEVLFRRLGEVGLDRNFILQRLLPSSLSASLTTATRDAAGTLSLKAAAYVGKIYGWDPSEIFGRKPLQIAAASIGGMRYKMPANADVRRVNAYTVYAHYLALIVHQATVHLAQPPITTDPYKIRANIIRKYRKMDLEQTLNYIWNLGIPVIPLDDPGVFHGACFRHEGRNIIILKQRTRSASRWAFDLLHELWHSAQEPNEPERATIEAQEIGKPPSIPEEERIASQFAGAALLGKNPQNLAEKCLAEADRDLRKLKWAVQKLARAEGLDVRFFGKLHGISLGSRRQ